MSGTRKHWQQRRVKGTLDIVLDPTRSGSEKSAPVHNGRGTPCNIAKNPDGSDCGRTAHRFIGSRFGCLDHQHLLFEEAARRVGKTAELPEVDFQDDYAGPTDEVAELA